VSTVRRFFALALLAAAPSVMQAEVEERRERIRWQKVRILNSETLISESASDQP